MRAGSARPLLPPFGPRPWSGVKVLFVVWGWTALLGPVVGLVLAVVLIVVAGLGLSGIGGDLAGSDPVGVAGAALAATFAVIVGFATGLVTGLAGGAAAAGVVDHLPPVLTGMVAGVVAAVTAMALPLVLAAQSEGSAPGVILIAAAVPGILVLATVWLIGWLTARRARRAAQSAQAAGSAPP